jgi:hypothetical protein
MYKDLQGALCYISVLCLLPARVYGPGHLNCSLSILRFTGTVMIDSCDDSSLEVLYLLVRQGGAF